MSLDPAASIIELLGGPTVVSRYLKTGANAPFRWRYPSEKLGTGGYIPTKYHDRLIELARERGFELPRAAFVDAEIAKDLLRRRREEAEAAA